MKELAIFNFGGVLVDSLGPHLDFCDDMNRIYKLNLDLPPKVLGRSIAEKPMSAFLKKAGFPEGLIPTIVDEHYTPRFNKDYPIRPFNGVPEMLRRLKEAEYKLAINSLNHHQNIQSALELNLRRIDCTVTKDDAKDKVEGIERCMDLLKVKKDDTIYIGDTFNDYNAAFRTGVAFIGVNFGWEISKVTQMFPVVTSIYVLSDLLVSLRE